MSTTPIAKCVHCKTPIPADQIADMRCHGCDSLVCEDCDTAAGLPFGRHRVERHWEGDEDDD